MCAGRALSGGVVVSILALLVASCGVASSPERPAEELPAEQARPVRAAAADVLYARAIWPSQDLVVLDAATGRELRRLPWGVPMRDWSVVYSAEFASGNTVLRALDAATGKVLRERLLGGPYLYELPIVGAAGEPGGLSPNGRWLALRARGVDSVTRSAFLVIGTDLRGPSTLVELEGNFGFDAIGDGGDTLYVEEHLPPARPIDGYRIRAYDLKTSSLLPGAIVDKAATGDRMTGWRVAALPSPDGQWLHSLYTSVDQPFIHGLNLPGKFSVCLFLPTRGTGNGEEQVAWTFAPAPDGRTAYAVNALMGVVAAVDLANARITSSATFSVARADGLGPLEALLRWFVPVAEAKAEAFSSAVVSPDGKTLFVVGGFGRGVLAVATDTLAVRSRLSTSTQIVGLGVSRDGSRLYVTESDGRALLQLDAASGTVLSRSALPGPIGRILRVASN